MVDGEVARVGQRIQARLTPLDLQDLNNIRHITVRNAWQLLDGQFELLVGECAWAGDLAGETNRPQFPQQSCETVGD